MANFTRTIVSIFFLFIIVKIGYSQNPDLQLINPLTTSPQAASFMKYGQIPVSMSSGVPEINIPLFNIHSGDINLPVSLSYHAGGIKVEEIAPNVGLGWNLAFGGVISRQVRGLADESSVGYENTGYWNAQYMNQQLTTAQLQAYYTGLRTGLIDGERDIYYYSLPGGESGKFFLDDQGNYISSPKTNIKIEKQGVGNAECWKFTDDGGIQYFFTVREQTSSESYERIDGDPAGSATSFSGTSSWYLEKITDSKGNTVNFSYTTNEIQYETKAVETKKLAGPQSGSGLPYCPISSTISSSLINTTWAVRIKNIRWGEGQISFDYNTVSRLDMENDTALSVISEIDKRGNVLKKYQLYTSYFYNPSLPPDYLDSTLAYRLKLDSLREISGSEAYSLPPYRFEYNDELMDSRLSNSQDYWGYYNGKNNAEFVTYYRISPYGDLQTLGANKNVDTVKCQANILKRIYYPAGGSTGFNYESNRYAVYQSGSFTDAGILATLYGENSGGDPGQTLYEYNQPFTVNPNDATTNGMAVIGVFMEQGGCEKADNSMCYNEVKLLCPGGAEKIFHNGDTLHLQPGNYVLNGMLETDYPGTPSLFLHVVFTLQTPVPNGYVDRYSGGVRIKKTTNYDNSQITGIKEYSYNRFGANYSSGSIGDDINMKSYHRQQTDHWREIIDLGQITHIEEHLCGYDVYSSTSNYPFMTSDGSYTTYANVGVEEKSTTSAVNGKSEYYYTSFEDYPDLITGHNAVPFPPLCSFEWKRGRLLKEKHYAVNNNGSFTLIQEKVNNYTFLSYNDPSKTEVNDIKFGTSDYYNGDGISDNDRNSGMLFAKYPTVSEIFYLSSDTTITYDKTTNDKLITINTYDYSKSPILLKSKLTNTSQEESIRTVYKYPSDYSSNGFVSGLISNNYIRYPLETYQSKVNSLGGEEVTAGSVTSYKSGKTVKDIIYTFRTTSPIPLSQYTISYMDGSGNLRMNNRYKSLLEFNKYDPYGNIQEQSRTNAPKEAFIWGYNHQYPVAKIIGSDYNTAIQWVDENILNSFNTSDTQMRQELNKLRGNLPNAQVTTYTYKPLTGITSITDPKGQTALYEYDDFKRLQSIKDHAGNIIKAYCYNYRGQATDCSAPVVLYSSVAKSQMFIKNNCSGSSSTGEQVYYTVPAGKYTSTISQADADQQAQNDINANGQNYANANGACFLSTKITRDMMWDGKISRISFFKDGVKVNEIFPANASYEEYYSIPTGSYSSIVFDFDDLDQANYQGYLSFVTDSGTVCQPVSPTVILSNVNITSYAAGTSEIWVAEYCH